MDFLWVEPIHVGEKPGSHRPHFRGEGDHGKQTMQVMRGQASISMVPQGSVSVQQPEYLTPERGPVKQGPVLGTLLMLSPFVILVRPAGSANLQLIAAAAPDAMVAMAAVSQSLRDSGQTEAVVVGVFRREDWAVMGQLFDNLEQSLQR